MAPRRIPREVAAAIMLALVVQALLVAAPGAEADHQAGAGHLHRNRTTTVGLEKPIDVEVSWAPDTPGVWVRDHQGETPNEGALILFNEGLSNLLDSTRLCGDTSDFPHVNALAERDGLSVNKENPGRPLWSCKIAGDRERAVVWATADGEKSDWMAIPGQDDPTSAMALDTRSLNNVTYSMPPTDSGHLDLLNEERRWARVSGPDFSDSAIDVASNATATTCHTGIFGGSRCFNLNGDLVGRDDDIAGEAVEVRNGTVWWLERENDPSLIHRTSTNLAPENQSEAPGATWPMDLSKTGRFVAHRNISGTNQTGEVTLRHAGNLSFIANVRPFNVTTSGPNRTDGVGVRNVQAIDWHPRDEGFYVLTEDPDELVFFNTTHLHNATTRTDFIEGTVTAPPEPEEENELIDLGEVAAGIGITPDSAGVFIGALLVAGFAGGLAIATRDLGPTVSTFMAALGAIGGSILAQLFGWWPLWIVFGMVVIAAISAVAALRNRTTTGGPPNGGNNGGGL